MKAKTIENIFNGYTKVEKLVVEQNGNDITLERVNRTDAVAAIVYDTNLERYVFVQQYRPGPNEEILELVAGKIDVDEDAESAITREIMEEIGYKVDIITEFVPAFYVSPGYTTEQMTIFYAEVSERVQNGGGLDEENECINVIHMCKDEVVKLLKNNQFFDGKTLLGMLIELNRK